jgi:hypothetical protein
MTETVRAVHGSKIGKDVRPIIDRNLKLIQRRK